MSTPVEQASTATPLLSDQVEESAAGRWRVLSAPTPVDAVVSFRGSFRTYPDFLAHENVLQDLVVALLDKGTHRRDRFALAEVLEDTGAQLNITSDGLRVRFSGKALPEHVPIVLEVLAEQLQEPLFDPLEVEKARAYVAASIQREMESTGAQAGSALSRLLYDADHPNYFLAPEDALAHIQRYTVEDVLRFYKAHFTPTDAIVVFCGALQSLKPDEIVAATLGAWQSSVRSDAPNFSTGRTLAATDHISMPDKSNSDVRMGQALVLRRQDPDFLPVHVGNYVLGGNFSARLMATIRDEMGLTYGIWSGLSGISTLHSGHWTIGVTLSPENFERGVRATLDVVRRFVEDGITAEEIEEKKTTITGAFKVGLATTGGMAATLLNNAERGFDVEYLDRYPEEVGSLDVPTVNDALSKHLRPSALSIAAAGPDPLAADLISS